MSTPSPAAHAGRADSATSPIRSAFVGQAVLIGATLAIYLLVVIGPGLERQDLDPYLQGAHDLLAGRGLYLAFLQHPFPDPTLRPAYIYPPAFALLVAPLALLPKAAAIVVWIVINQAALAGALTLAVRWLRPSRWALAAMLAATATFYPLWIDAVQGQANLLIVLLVTLGLFGVARADDRFAAAFGAAAALKLTPALLLIWLVAGRRWRAAAWMVAGFGAVTAFAALVRFADTMTFFTRVLPALAHGTAVYANQSLGGFLLRLFSANPYTQPLVVIPPAILLLLSGALLVAWWFLRRPDRPPPELGGLLFLPLLPLLSAVTWPHHFVILLPLLWACLHRLGERQWPVVETAVVVATLVVFDVMPRLGVGPAFGEPGFRAAQTHDPMVIIAGNALLFGTLLIFLAAPWLLRSR